MNEDMNAFEEELRKIRPAAPAPELLTRLEKTQPQAATPARPEQSKLLRFSFRMALPLAAAAMVIISVNFCNQGRVAVTGNIVSAPAQVAELQVRPAETVDCILGAREIGTCTASDGNPYKVVQCVGLSHQVWENTKDGRRVAQTVPRQRVLLVSMDTY